MSEDFIDYGQLIDDAMHIIVKKALETVQQEGLPGKHHFFISFLTGYPGVDISSHLREKYPDEMTIVLQHQFSDLLLTDVGFSVVLSFDNVKEKIVVPFDSLVAFADPSVKFGLQFRHAEDLEMDEDDYAEMKEFSALEEEAAKQEAPIKNTKAKSKTKETQKSKSPKKATNVVSLDTFRKK